MKAIMLYAYLSKCKEQDLQHLISLLYKEDAERILQYQHKYDRNIRLLSRKLLTEAVGYFLPNQPLPLHAVRRKNNGKIYFENISLQFSVAHSEDICMVAAHPKYMLGVDVEYRKPIKPSQLHYFLTDEEIEIINKNKFPEKIFYQIWTRKEAALKASGTGILIDLKTVNAMEEIIRIQNEIYYSQCISIDEHYEVQLASDTPNLQIEKREIIF